MLDGARVKAARKALGLLQEDLAALLNVTPCTVSKIEKDHYPGMSLEMAELLSWLLRKSLGELLKSYHPPPGLTGRSTIVVTPQHNIPDRNVRSGK